MKHIVTLLFVFMFISGYAQKYDKPGNWGLEYRRTAVDTQFNVPFLAPITPVSQMSRPGAITCSPADSLLRLYTGNRWMLISPTLFNVDDYGATPHYVDSTDNDAVGWQAAINACRASGWKGKVVASQGIYHFRSPVVNATAPRFIEAQIYLPYDTVTSPNKGVLVIEGAAPPNFVMTSIFSNITWNQKATIIKSTISGTGNIDAVIGVDHIQSGLTTGNNGNGIIMSNIGVVIHDGFNRLSGVTFKGAAFSHLRNIDVCIDTPAAYVTAPQSLNNCIGIRGSGNLAIPGFRSSSATDCNVYSQGTGFRFAGDVYMNNNKATVCGYSFYPNRNFTPSLLDRAISDGSKHAVATLDHAASDSATIFSIQQLTVKNTFKVPAGYWFSPSYTVNDSFNIGFGTIRYQILDSNGKLANSTFTKLGGAWLTIKPVVYRPLFVEDSTIYKTTTPSLAQVGAVGDTTVKVRTDTIVVGGQSRQGNSVTPNTASVVNNSVISNSFTNPTASIRGLYSEMFLTQTSGANNLQYAPMRSLLNITANNTQNFTNAAGIVGNFVSISSSAGSSGIVSQANIARLSYSTTGMSATTVLGINITQFAGTITNAVGIGITALSATNNTYLLLGTTTPVTGSWGLYSSHAYNNYLGSGNTLINTTTDGGFKLDVNGTGRYSGNLTLSKIAGYNGAITDGQLMIGHTGNGTFEKGTLTAGAGVSLINGAGSITVATSGIYTIRSISASTTILTTDKIIEVTSGTFTQDLPAAVAGKEYYVTNTGAGTITLQGSGGQTISGSAVTINTGFTAHVVGNTAATGWILLNQ